MLEFIVLGIVPGTHIQLSPVGVVLLWAGATLVARFLLMLRGSYRLLGQYKLFGAYYTVVTRKHRITRRLNNSFQPVSLEEYSDHTVAAPPANIAVHP